jgi:uncharacterized membrane protein YgcG
MWINNPTFKGYWAISERVYNLSKHIFNRWNMRKIIILIFTLGFWGLLAPMAGAQDVQPEAIDSFDAQVSINADASFKVLEKIQYDFGTAQKHGIFRDIPIKYQARGGNYNLRLGDISVKDEQGNSYNFTISYPGNNLEIKIGDANMLVSGKKMYVINYVIGRAINYFDTYDEFYWNATGNGWPVAIKKATLKVSLPQNVNKESLQSECFIGPFGSTEKCQNDLADSTGLYWANRELAPGEGLTVVFGFPKGIVHEPSAGEKFLEALKDNGILFLPVIILLFMLWLWRQKGRDPEGRGTIIAQFDAPDNLTPLEVGTVVDEKADKKDISAEIIYLAVRGYLKIKKTESKILFITTTDYVLEKLKNAEMQENDFDKKLMSALFDGKESVKLTELKNTFYKSLKEINEKIYENVLAKGYFPKNPDKVRKIYLGAGMIILFVGIFFINFWGTLGVVSFILSGSIVMIFSSLMPRKTLKGVAAKEYILGLKEYLRVAEKDRLEFHNAPSKNPERFEKLLPYAMVLGVEKEWAQQFQDIYKQNPSWYEDGTGHPSAFNSLIFVNSLNSFSQSANASLASNPSSASSGGSGFSGGGSGGGFGGGGGGSW